MAEVRRLGVVGGTGPESTFSYYRAVIAGVQEIEGGVNCLPPLVINSVSAFDILDYCSRQDYEGLAGHLLSTVKHLAAAAPRSQP